MSAMIRGGLPALTRLRASRAARVGLALVALLVLFALLGPVLSSHDTTTSDFVRGATDTGPAEPGRLFWLGADRLYRDQFTRLAHGGRISLFIGLTATAIATVLGATAGILSGYYEGTRGVRVPWLALVALALAFAHVVLGSGRVVVWLLGGHGLRALALIVALGLATRLGKLREGPRLTLDAALMRFVDVGLAFPFLLLVMALGTAFERTSATTILFTLGLTGWLGIARVVRAKTISVKNLDFVMAARALGQSTPAILLRHVLPNVSGAIVVLATVSVAQMIVAESVMSYLGVGLSPPTPTWGYMLFEGQEVYVTAPWLLFAPAAAILVAVLGFNLLGEGLRDALDPRSD